jgi:hypothetical protein
MTTDAIAVCCGAHDEWRTDDWVEEDKWLREFWAQTTLGRERLDELDAARRSWRSALSSTRRALASMESAGLVQRESWRDGIYGQYPWAITQAGRKFLLGRGN